jgi:multiple sugar transport system permease protein
MAARTAPQPNWSPKYLLGRTPLSRRRALWGLALVAPNTLGLLFFFGIPVILSFVTAFHQWNGIKPPIYIGLDNFTRLLNDSKFWQAVGNTVKLTIFTVPIGTLLSLGAAILLNQRLRGRNFFRTIYFLPVVTSTVAASIVWAWIFQAHYGLLNNLLAPFGLLDLNWLTRPDLVMIPLAVVTVWQRVGFYMVLFLAGLQTVPRILYEAALIDGATRWQRFRHITIPMLSPKTFLIVVLSIIGSFQIFDQVFIMTARTSRGGVGGSATTLSYFLYESGFINTEFGYASAVGLAMFVMMLAITVVQLRLQRRWVYYESTDG